MKVTVIGGGSTYTPELIQGFLARVDSFPLSELWLVDVDGERLDVVGGFARRMVAAQGAPFKVQTSLNRRAALEAASYVITQMRVGLMAARRADEYLGRRHGLIGQETTGLGGMAKALRTIPVLLQIAEEIGRLAPDALLVNFTNPAGLVTEALARYSDTNSIGVCNVPITAKMTILAQVEKLLDETIDPGRVQLDTLGLNHLSWHRGFWLDGDELWPRLMEAYLAELRAAAEPEWDPALIETLGMLPNYYLNYYYETAHKLAEQEKWPPSRADEVMVVEDELLRQYADPAASSPPGDLMKRGGAYYSTMATQLLNAHYNDLGERHILNIRHSGAVAGWPDDWVLEMPCLVNKGAIRPLPAEPLPPVCYGLLAQVKSYELLTVEAAVHGDREAAYQALLAHPLGPPAHKIPAVLDDLLATHRQHLPQFWK